MSTEISITTQDLASAGIEKSAITTHDIIEIIANEIYQKTIDDANDLIKDGKDLENRFIGLFDKDFDDIINHATSLGYTVAPNFEKSWKLISSDPCAVSIKKISSTEDAKGFSVSTRERVYSAKYIDEGACSVLLKITSSRYTKTKQRDGAIIVETEEQIETTFEKSIDVDASVFHDIVGEIKEYNDSVNRFLSSLPKNKYISLTKMVSDARIKFNKQLLSSQSKDFKDKMLKLFNVKL